MGFWASEKRLSAQPKKIISVVPSQTELLFDLGLQDQVIGITLFCVHPKSWFKTKKRIGGTKNLKTDSILQMNPDLLIANLEENTKEQIEEIAQEIPVYVTNIDSFESALDMIFEIGTLVGKQQEAENLINQIHLKESQHVFRERYACCYLIWENPYMTIGGDTFISNMLAKAGFLNVFQYEKRYPVITIEEIQKKKPDYLFLSSEPFPFHEKHREELQSELEKTKVIIVDGEMFSWYGSRMIHAFDYFGKLRKSLNA